MARVVLKLEDDISTDIIYPGRFMATVLPTETPQFAFADDPDFNGQLVEGRVPQGSAIVAGYNFGSGSSREQAASTLEGHGLIIVAKSFARIFLQNSINLGLRTIACPEMEADAGDELVFIPLLAFSAQQDKSGEEPGDHRDAQIDENRLGNFSDGDIDCHARITQA